MYAKDPDKVKYQLLISKYGGLGLKHCNDSKAFIEYSNDMDDIFENIGEYNPNKERKMSIVFDYLTADILICKKLQQIVTVLFTTSRKLNISLLNILD